jgi:hypothetical protein
MRLIVIIREDILEAINLENQLIGSKSEKAQTLAD